MPYIGNTVQNQGFAPAIDYFNGDGVTVTFTLSRPVASVAQLTAVIDNVIQNPSSAFTVSGNAITFTSAPLAGTNNIWVEYTSLVTTYAAISQDPSVIGDITASGGYLATGDFGNSYIDGTIVDYVTGNARITTGPIDDMTFYHGGTASRSEMMRLSYAGNSYIVGNLGIDTTPNYKLDVNGRTSRVATSTTLNAYTLINNTSGDLYVGVEGSTAGTLFTGTTAYASAIGCGAAKSLQLATNNTVRMTIDSSGQMTLPYQPSFVAYRSSSVVQSGPTSQVSFNATYFNTGSHFSTSTGRFTAPIAGKYFFTAQVYRNTNTTTAYFGSLIRQNGATWLAQSYVYGQGGDISPYATCIANLAAGDYVEVYSDNQGTAFTMAGSSSPTATVFVGYLLG